MPLNASSILFANSPQMPNGTAVNASARLGLPGLGSNLQDDAQHNLEEQRKKRLNGMDMSSYGASGVIFGTLR